MASFTGCERMTPQPVFVYARDLLSYKFHDSHPFNPLRVQLTYELLQEVNALHPDQVIPPRKATDDEIALIHSQDYIDAVKKASRGELDPVTGQNFGLGSEDTPIFTGMHDASAWLVGGTLTAVEQVMEGHAPHALNLGGGLHHGFRGKASGFCIYNDSAIAIEYMRQKYDVRVLYIDTDAHHGDGVQLAFYDDPNVATLSIHETGRYLFPGTGQYNERGHGNGYGTSFNIPVDAFTEDDSWLSLYKTAIEEVTRAYQPDVILTQNGADSHYYDPLTHLSLTMKTYEAIPRIAHEIAHKYTDGRWIAVGGGGYDMWRVVPRAWANVWLGMNDLSRTGVLPEAWRKKWSPYAKLPIPETWEDSPHIYDPIPRRTEIEEKNRQTLDKALRLLHKNG